MSCSNEGTSYRHLQPFDRARYEEQRHNPEIKEETAQTLSEHTYVLRLAPCLSRPTSLSMSREDSSGLFFGLALDRLCIAIRILCVHVDFVLGSSI